MSGTETFVLIIGPAVVGIVLFYGILYVLRGTRASRTTVINNYDNRQFHYTSNTTNHHHASVQPDYTAIVQSVILAMEAGARLHKLPNGRAIALFPDNTYEPLTAIEEATWREVEGQ